MERKLKGFNLIELMVVIAILGIVLSIAIPSFYKWIKSASIKNDTLQLFAFIQKCRFISFSSRINTKLVLEGDKSLCFYCQDVDLYCKSIYPGKIACYDAKNTISSNSQNPIYISKVGYFETRGSFFIGDGSAYYDTPKFNCISISLIRVRLGKDRNGSCEF